MSDWHRDNPELIGTAADPWMIHENYRRALPTDLDNYDRARDEAREADMDRMERESAEDERREIEGGGR